MTPSGSQKSKSPSQMIDARIKELGDWRGETLSRLRALVKEVDPDVVEEWKWRGVPTWYHDGMVCTGETYKTIVKMTFAKGALLKDPSGLFNSSLEGNVRRAIDFHEGEKINEKALKVLLRAAMALERVRSQGLNPPAALLSVLVPAPRGSGPGCASAPRVPRPAGPTGRAGAGGGCPRPAAPGPLPARWRPPA